MRRRIGVSTRLGLLAWAVRRRFEHSKSTAPPGHENAVATTSTIEDVSYGSSLPDGLLDLHLPARARGPSPLVVLIHGGGFVGGDKSANRIYATELAARGFVVANMNYRRAPEAKYPSPLVQVGEAYRFLRFGPFAGEIDPGKVFLAGDSAGAQIAAQFALVQVDPAYAALLGLASSVRAEDLRGVLLFCGPYDLGRVLEEANPLLRFAFLELGSLYFGRRDWISRPMASQASLVDRVGPSFPPAFVTDGNWGSFEGHGKALAARLRELGVPVTTLFHDQGKGRLTHQYQYVLDTEAGRVAFEAALTFLSSLSI